VWREAQRREHERLWPGVELLVSGLPPILSGQVKLLEYDLALRYSPSGQFTDIFLGADQFPLLSIGSWLIEDLSLLTGPKRERAEWHLFRAAVLVAARSHAIRSILDSTSFYDAEHVAIVQFLSERLMTELSRFVPAGSRSWELQEAIAVDGLEAMLAEQQVRRAPVVLEEPETYLTGRWSAPGRLLALAALTVGRRLETASSVDALLYDVAGAFEIKSDLVSMHADLLAGRPTYPIAFVARVAGLSLEPWPDARLVLGALVATNSLGSIVDAAITRLRDSRRLAADLGLRTFAEYLLDVEAGLVHRRPTLAHDPAAKARGAGGRPAVAPSHGRVARTRSNGDSQARRPTAPLIALTQPSLAKALEMAEGFLLADLTFRESWESHREGMFGSPAVASRFPAGLILEILHARGHDVSTPIDDFLAFTANNHFRYYDHPWSDIDSDTVGVYLRLTPYAATGGRGEAATPVLACLERDVAENGHVPVWITNCEGSPRERPFMLNLGEGCGTVAAHLLLSLLAYAPDRYAATIERGSMQLIDRIGEIGLGVNVNYPPVFALAVFGRLIAKVEDSGQGFIDGQAKRAAGKARRMLVSALDRAMERRVLTAQQAALLTIACLDLKCSEKADPRWQTTILKRQRFDGSWIGEPFAAAPNRGLAVTWYSSTLLTSALCYDALMSSSAYA
jgi:hypothetical protein